MNSNGFVTVIGKTILVGAVAVHKEPHPEQQYHPLEPLGKMSVTTNVTTPSHHYAFPPVILKKT